MVRYSKMQYDLRTEEYKCRSVDNVDVADAVADDS
jgi:hypothetical protein